MYKTKQFTLIFNSLHPKTVQSPLIIFWTSGPFKYFLTRRNLTSENITNESEICRSIFCRIEVNFMKFNSLTQKQQQSASKFVNSQKILFHQNVPIPFYLLLNSYLPGRFDSSQTILFPETFFDLFQDILLPENLIRFKTSYYQKI